MVFFGALNFPKDPDLGWHLKYGEYTFLNHRILRENTLSSFMPDYKWANGAWGSDLITYITYKFWGFGGLTVLGAGVVTLTFLFFSLAARLTFWDQAFIFPIVLFAESLHFQSSYRGESLSLMFIGISGLILERCKRLSKLIFLPILFLIWCNLHQEFLFGMGLLTVWVALMMFNIRKKKGMGLLGVVLSSSFLVTLINPFGWRIHLVALSHINDPLLKRIIEYEPFSVYSVRWWLGIVFLVLFIIYLVANRKNIRDRLPYVAVIGLLLVAMFWVRRYSWSAYYLFIPILTYYSRKIGLLFSKYRDVVAVVLIVAALGYIIHLKSPVSQYFTKMNWNKYCKLQLLPCSSKSAEFLRR